MNKPVILLVDDEPSNIKLLGKILADDYRLRVARDGNEALVRSSIEPYPDLILLDIMMPGMDGLEVCRKLKSNPVTEKIPIIFVTAKVDTNDIVQGFKYGAVDYITKPFWREELTARISTHLELKFNREKLEVQKAELERAASIRDDVDRMMRHDLKGALTPILVLPQFIMADEPLSETGKTHINVILNSGKKLLELIDLSVLMIKMERGSYTIRPEPINVVEVAQEVVLGLNSLFMTHSSGVRLLLNESPPTDDTTAVFQGESVLLFNMLNNLLKNAAEASFPGEEVLLDILTGAGLTIKISNRRVVPDHIRDTFFDKYVTAEKAHGTGIGTYSAKLMAEVLGGEISMSSTEANGTTVSIFFPA